MFHQQAVILLEQVQRGGARDGVQRCAEPDAAERTERSCQSLTVFEDWARHCPLSHLHREGDQQNDVAHHGWVKGVKAHAAVEVLGQYDRGEDSDGDNPPGAVGRQCQSQQYTGHQGTAVVEVKHHRALAQL